MNSNLNLRSAWVLLFCTYCILLVSGSLYPLSTWQSDRAFDLAFLWAAWPRTITRIDLITNLAIYIPFGIFAMRALFRRHYSLAHWLCICLLGAAFSTSMECLQLFLPTRVASNVDILANSAGTAIGAGLASFVSRRGRLFIWLAAWRRHWFRPGWVINLSLILLALWVLAQFNLQKPGLVAGSLHGGFSPFWESNPANFRPVIALLFALEIACVSLFISILLRPGQHIMSRTARFTLSAILLKFMTAALLIKLVFLIRLLSLEALLGLTLGASAALALIYFRAKPPPHPLLAGILSVFILTKIMHGAPFLTATGRAPDLATQPELLLNISGVAFLVAELWPYLALGCTLALWEREN